MTPAPKQKTPSKIGLRDVLLGAGIFLTAFGAGLIYLPAGIIVPGLSLLYLGMFGVPAWR